MVQIQPARRKWLKRLKKCSRLFLRRDLNYPPTPVGGIQRTTPQTAASRLDLNHPPTPVGGISDFEAKPRISIKTLAKLPMYFSTRVAHCYGAIFTTQEKDMN